MYSNALEIICDAISNGDHPGQNILRSLFTPAELTELIQESEKAAAPTATLSEQN